MGIGIASGRELGVDWNSISLCTCAGLVILLDVALTVHV